MVQLGNVDVEFPGHIYYYGWLIYIYNHISFMTYSHSAHSNRIRKKVLSSGDIEGSGLFRKTHGGAKGVINKMLRNELRNWSIVKS